MSFGSFKSAVQNNVDVETQERENTPVIIKGKISYSYIMVYETTFFWVDIPFITVISYCRSHTTSIPDVQEVVTHFI